MAVLQIWSGAAWVQIFGGSPSTHTIASHLDTDATGAELNTLTDGSNADALHKHSATLLTATNWRVFHSNGSGAMVELALGASGTVLKSNGASAAPTWVTPKSLHTITQAGIFQIDNPIAGDARPLKGIPANATITFAEYKTDTGTVTFNVEKRPIATPQSAGTDIWTADKTATSTTASTTSFDSEAVVGRNRLVCAITSVASSPTVLDLWVEWTVD